MPVSLLDNYLEKCDVIVIFNLEYQKYKIASCFLLYVNILIVFEKAYKGRVLYNSHFSILTLKR